MHGCIRLKSGRRFFYENPKPNQLTLEDIVWSISRLPRFLGHTNGPVYSVGQHSCVTHDLAPIHCKREALGHDMVESVVGDCPSPLKDLLPGYRDKELSAEQMLAKRFKWQYPFPADVKRVDLIALATEMRDLTNRTDWRKLPYPPADIVIKPWPEEKTRREFMKRWKLYYR